MSPHDMTVYIVDDDPSVRDALGLMLSVRNHRTATFADAASFLASYQPRWRGCLLLDLRMPEMDGLALQARLNEIGSALPVIVITGHGDVESARVAFRSRAVDFLEKPIDHSRLMASIEEAFRRSQSDESWRADADSLARRLAALTPREHEIMALVVAGRHNRDIATALGISPRTVEVHKARVMQKLDVQSVPDLVRLSLKAEGPHAGR